MIFDFMPAKWPLAILVPALCSCSPPAPEIEPGVSLELARHRASIISEVSYRLGFRIPESQDEHIHGSVAISFMLVDDAAPLQLDFRESADKISQVTSNGAESDYRFGHEHIVIPAADLVVGTNLVEIEFTAGSTSLNRNPEYLYTLFVPDRARTAFPLFDQPDLKATYELTLDIPADWTAMSNAPIGSVEESDERHVYRFHESDRISSYLFSFVAGKFDTISQERDGRSMTMLHRETDADKVARNVGEIFDLHAAALAWLEEYTGIDYPYQKLGFALIPAFQYGGMEHVGAIQYRASGLLLDEAPSETLLLGRAGLIAHETAHMWFGNLVTMEWFNDVWTKEVFANFMAAKIVNPSFPEINHDLNFLVRHYPGAYSVDRTTGANPIRQHLPNLNEAGQMYGAIIYNKAPIMMRQLEMMIGEELFREGMRDYLALYSFANATWPALIDILDRKTDKDLKSWSDVWVNTPGRPEMATRWETSVDGERKHLLVQHDPAERERVWPQEFDVLVLRDRSAHRSTVVSEAVASSLGDLQVGPGAKIIFNAGGRGYGLFPADITNLDAWDQLDDVAKAAELVNLYENLWSGSGIDVREYFLRLADLALREENQLIIDLLLGQMQRIYWTLLPDQVRAGYAPELEESLWQAMLQQTESSSKKIFFDAFADVAISAQGVQRTYEVWSGSLTVEDLPLSEDDRIRLAQTLAIKLPAEADAIVAGQLASTGNPDNVRKLTFVAPSLSADSETRDGFFFALAQQEMRTTESWVLDALSNIHHPLRTEHSEKYILPSLELLQEIQVTGDIFFPKRWLDATLGNHRSTTAVQTVRTFLDERPDYNEQLRMKILQSADMMFRANTILSSDEAE